MAIELPSLITHQPKIHLNKKRAWSFARHFELFWNRFRRSFAVLDTVELLDQFPAVLAHLIQKRLGRPLEPFDIWYDGFIEKQPEGELSKLTRARYPTAEAYKKDIPRLLQGLGFTAEKARWIDSHIE